MVLYLKVETLGSLCVIITDVLKKPGKNLSNNSQFPSVGSHCKIRKNKKIIARKENESCKM